MLLRLLAPWFVALLLVPSLPAQASPAPPPVRWSGYIQARETYQDEVGLTSSINRARLTAGGSVRGDIGWRVQGEFRTGNAGTGRATVALQDAYVRWSDGRVGVQLGQFKTPFTREFITSLTEVESADRAFAVDTLAPKRDIGIMADYAAGGRGGVTVGLFNGDGQNVTSNADSSLLGVGRATWRLIPYVAIGANVAHYFGDSTRYGSTSTSSRPGGRFARSIWGSDATRAETTTGGGTCSPRRRSRLGCSRWPSTSGSSAAPRTPCR
jgi:phosphate-selective porin